MSNSSTKRSTTPATTLTFAPSPTPPAESKPVDLTADDGQATAEYALVMLAAASLAGLLLAWVTSTDAVGRLMDAVLDSILSGI